MIVGRDVTYPAMGDNNARVLANSSNLFPKSFIFYPLLQGG